ncbi:MAG: hypothetical protein P1V35_05360, partial [Planctomycetota bacterium]|nr:hypothetical protein [Planctomycetota bacterium]
RLHLSVYRYQARTAPLAAGHRVDSKVDADLAAAEGRYWLAVSHTANAKTTVNVGYGMDDAEDDDLAANGITENSTLFVNVMHALNSATSLGFEVGQHDTGYKGAADEDATRVQFSATFSF